MPGFRLSPTAALRPLPLVAALVLLFAVALPAAGPAAAQGTASLTDLRADLDRLTLELESLKSDLLASGGSVIGDEDRGPLLSRIQRQEDALRAALGRIETLENRIRAVSEDGARRISDLDFRLTIQEGGDTSLVIDQPPLGGQAAVPQPDDGQQAPVATSGETGDFDRAIAALEAGDAAEAVQLFAQFVASYPDGPLTGEARFLQGEAFTMMGDAQNAARSYLNSFSSAPDAPSAPRALFGLAISLHALGQTEQACLTLAEVRLRFGALTPDMERALDEQQAAMGCR